MLKKKDEKDYVIVTDTASDLPEEILKEFGIIALPMHVIIDGKDYLHYADFRNLSKEDFYNAISGETPVSTSQVDLSEAESTLRSILEDEKNILCISVSSGISGTYSGVKMVSDELAEEFPESEIYVIDSLCASGGEGLLVYMAAKNKEAGMDIRELSEWVENNKLKVGHWFTVDDLEHLRKGGRISSTASCVGNLLNIKPILYTDSRGCLAPHSKCSGRKKSISILADKMLKFAKGKNLDTVFISHANCIESAETLKNKITENFKIGEIIIVDIDPIIAAHTGAGCLALFFSCEKNRE